MNDLSQQQSISVDHKGIWASLLFSLFYFLPMVFNFEHFFSNAKYLIVLIYLIFIALYILAVKIDHSHAIWPIVGIILLCALGAGIYPGTNALFGYAAFLAAFNYPRRAAVIGLLANILAQFLAALAFNLVHVYFLFPSLLVTISLFILGYFSRKSSLQTLALARSSDQIEQLTAIAERERIARDLHDVVGHSLTSIALKSELAEKLLDNNESARAKTEFSQVAELARQVLSDIRHAVSDIKFSGLEEELRKLVSQLEQAQFVVNCETELTPMNARLESSVVLILKEATTNILRHSQGDRVDISLQSNHTVLNLNIADNGKIDKLVSGNGLQGIKERCQSLGGTCTMTTDAGVRLSIKLPIGRLDD